MKKRLFMLAVVLIAVVAGFAQGWDTTYKEIDARIKAPTFKEKTFLVTKYGAKADKKETKAVAAANQKAINKAIIACNKAGGGKVIVPAGTYYTGAITLKSNVNLEVQKGAILKFAFERDLYPNVETRWEGLNIINYQPCVYAVDCKNIGLTGEGVVDGNGSNERWWYMKGNVKDGYHEGVDEWQGTDKLGTRADLIKMADKGVATKDRVFGKGKGLRPQLVNFVRCENCLIQGVKLKDSPFWVIHPLFCKNLSVKGVEIFNDGPNGDGCDPESCEDVLIEGCTFHTGDDCIALKSGRNADGLKAAAPCKNVIIRKCTMADGHGGVVIGSEISGGVQNIYAEDCDMDSPNLDRVIRIKTNTCRGGINENIFVRNIRVGQCKEAVMRINLVYEPKEIAERGHIPTVRNVYVENVTCKKSKYGILLNGLEEKECKDPQIYNINVKNCKFGGMTDLPVKTTGLIKDIHIKNVTISANL